MGVLKKFVWDFLEIEYGGVGLWDDSVTCQIGLIKVSRADTV